MSIYDIQLRATWALWVEHDDQKMISCGGALCFTPKGYLVTAHHLFDEVKDRDTVKIFGQMCNNPDLFEIGQLYDLPTLDITILKVKKSRDDFLHMDLKSQIKIEIGERLVCHGHANGILFSSLFAKTSFAYERSTDLATLLEDINITIAKLDRGFVIEKRKNYPTPTFRAAISCLVDYQIVLSETDEAGSESESDTDASNDEALGSYHPNLPLVELGSPSLDGYSGCPVFSTDGVDGINNFGEVVGMLICQANSQTYVVPSDVLYYAIYTLLDGKLDV